MSGGMTSLFVYKGEVSKDVTDVTVSALSPPAADSSRFTAGVAQWPQTPPFSHRFVYPDAGDERFGMHRTSLRLTLKQGDYTPQNFDLPQPLVPLLLHNLVKANCQRK